MLDALFRACGSADGARQGLGLDAALRVLRDAKRAGLLTPAKQQVARQVESTPGMARQRGTGRRVGRGWLEPGAALRQP